uniref:PNPLA domain-containing protein n=1 Tax=viral metagenome TaxID=1070528 RepID=A0A6C0LJU7_9ZZZZ
MKEYINKLIDNLPDNITRTKTPIIIDLVLDGGAFNGSYLSGALQFLKEMENRRFIKIRRISGCSIGSLSAFLFFVNRLDVTEHFSKLSMIDFKKTSQLIIIKDIKTHILHLIPDNFEELLNEKMFISYYNLKKNKKVIKNTYKSKDDIIDSIIKSCFLPFIIDGNICFKNKYVDGLNPYLFETEKGVKTLHLDLFGFDKCIYMLNIKHEKSATHRILSGLLEIHNFFVKQTNTSMCSYVNDWWLTHKIYFLSRIVLEKTVIFIIIWLIQIYKWLKPMIEKSTLLKITNSVIKEIFIIICKRYFL